ncbi:paraquat-inducible protein A [Salmonella enterica subsp. enterica]|uniref:Paraquat-inducible protein A n=8 Tax=Salmonella enterica TaxID=28901 RepID=A0A3S4LZJ1_SALET|nr:paraquat-inducible protein A [Salmonella enterica subsp. enterica]
MRVRSKSSIWRRNSRWRKKNEEVIAPKAEIVKRGSSKLSYKLQRELEQLPGQLEDLEAKLEALQAQVADAAFFSQPHEQTQKVLADLSQAEQELEQAFERWEYLEGLKKRGITKGAPMCEHHHAAKHILCPQCDMLVALPRLSHGQKAACPRCGATLTTEWDAPRQRPTAYALAALFMLLLSNLFPFVNMNVAGVTSEVTLLEIPGVMFSEDYASLGTFFLLFVQLVPAFCLVTILLLVNRASLPLSVKKTLARIFFLLKSWGMAEIFLAGVLVSFVKLMAYGDIGIGSSFIPWCLFCLVQLRAFQCVDRRWLWDDIAPQPALAQPLTPGITGIRQSLRSCACCTAILPAESLVCPRCHTKGYVRRKNSLQWTLALLFTLDHALSARQYFADYDYRLTGLENAVDHSGWRDFCCGARGLIRWRRLSFSPVLWCRR